jgi:ribosomal-protein-alanine N-acetyltransferase
MTEDVGMVTRIEREAFPTLWPPTSLKREMENRRVRYLVAWEPIHSNGNTPHNHDAPTAMEESKGGLGLGRLVSAVKSRLGPRREETPLDYGILGFVGLWFMADEAHITAIAVEEVSRGRGIGELLLIGSIDLAMQFQSSVVTLEARVSNNVARSLYDKYGFEDMGMRKAYYTDNREDAVIMTTESIQSRQFQDKYRDLRGIFERRYGEPSIIIA